MGKWATYQKRGGGVVPPVNSPVLALVPSDNLSWTWPGTDPDSWELENGPTAVGPWTHFDNVPGSDRSISHVDVGLWYRITGLDSGSAPVTNPSNAVEVP